MSRCLGWALRFLSVAAPLVLAAQGVQAQPAEASQPRDAGLAASAPQQPSVAAGRELFSRHCSRCHGPDARGSAGGPNLLLRVPGMSEAGFASAVLQRYRWSVPASESGGESSGREAMLRGVLSRQTDPAAMPAWESDPAVSQGVKALYEFLNAQAGGGR